MLVDQSVPLAYSGAESHSLGAADSFADLDLSMATNTSIIMDSVSPTYPGANRRRCHRLTILPPCIVDDARASLPDHAGWAGTFGADHSMALKPTIELSQSAALADFPDLVSGPQSYRRPRSLSGASPASDRSYRSSQKGHRKDTDPEWGHGRSMDPPFDIPEELRVHEAVIGPEKEEGSWVLMFRKLNGLDGGWDLQTVYVPALTG